MLCQACFQAEASMHVLDRPSDDRLVESHYCLACYELKYVNPPTGWIAVPDDAPPVLPPAFPMRRFAIRDMMIIAGIFAILNAAIALFLRSGLIKGTPTQLREWTTRAFLVANPSVAIFLAEVTLHTWLRRLHLHQITGGLPPSRLKSICRSVERRIAWEGACPLERALLIACTVWPLTLPIGFAWWIPRRVLSLVIARCDPWLLIAAIPLMIMGVQTVLLCGLIASTRRR